MITTHWTENSPENFLYSIASDFIEQLRTKMKRIGMSQSKLARAAKVSKGYVSQVFNDPGNLTLITIVKFAEAAGMKVSVVGYEDDTAKGTPHGPVNADVFRMCWERQGRPTDMWSLKEPNVAATPNTIDVKTFLENHPFNLQVFPTRAQPTKPAPAAEGADFDLPLYINQRSRLAGGGLTAGSMTLGE
jgi:transcriptional regulator with XRE-family HTH domain